MKGVYRRKDTWWLRFTPAPGAAQMRISLGTHDEAEAIVKARRVMEEEGRVAREKLDACATEVEAYLASKRNDGRADSTLQSQGYVLYAFVDAIGASSPLGISRPAVQRWFDCRRRENEHTAVAYLQIVRYWMSWLVRRGKLARDPTEDIVIPTLRMRRRKRFLMPQEARRLLEECGEDEGLRFAVYCALHAGLRKNEVIEARPEWFDLDAKLLHIQETPTFQPKDRDARTVPLTDEFCAWLREDYGLREPFMLKPEVKQGRYRYRYDFRTAFENLVVRCKFENLTFHDLRRTFASLHVSRGTSIYKVAKWLGDAVDVVEDTYGHLIPQDEEINRAWETPEKTKGRGRSRGDR